MFQCYPTVNQYPILSSISYYSGVSGFYHAELPMLMMLFLAASVVGPCLVTIVIYERPLTKAAVQILQTDSVHM
jgi:hypothetical protein